MIKLKITSQKVITQALVLHRYDNRTTMLAQITTQADALAAQFPGVSRDKLIEIAGEVTSSQPKARKPYARKVVPAESRCCARVWGTGSGKDQCSKSKMDGSDFCKAHAAKHAENPCPCQLDDSGKRIGLFRAFPQDRSRASARTGEMIGAALSAAVRSVLLYRSLVATIEEVAEARREAQSA